MLLHDSLPSKKTIGSAFGERCAQSHNFLDVLPVSLLALDGLLRTVINPDDVNVTNVQELAERAGDRSGKQITVDGVTVKVEAFRR
jgi:hypothetical protein